jgi:hypothetical protein
VDNAAMRNFVAAPLLAVFAIAALGQELNLQDPAQLVGKHVIVSRDLPLCEPGTYNATIAYYGKTALVESIKPKGVKIADNILNRMAPQMQDMMRDQRKAAVILLKFEDGKEFDSCAQVGPKKLSEALALAPGESLTASVEPAPAPTAAATAPAVGNGLLASPVTASHQNCPVEVTKATSTDGGFGHGLADRMTTSEYQRQTDETLHGGMGKHYLDMRLKNISTKLITAIESVASYVNVMGDPSASTTFTTQNSKPIKPGQENRSYTMDREMLAANGKGQVIVYVQRVRFEDGTFWTDNGSHSCSLTNQIKP